MNGIFGWSYPPGCSGPPDNDAPPIDLTDDRTLKGYGRRQHGLNGKDADLDPAGQNIVKEAYWFEDGTIRISGHRYASLVPDSEATDGELDIYTELVCGCDYPGEWGGDYWVLGEDYALTVTHPWNDDLADEANIVAATVVAFNAIDIDSQAFERAMSELNEAFETVQES